MKNQAPGDLRIEPRHPNVDVEPYLASDWMGGDAFRTAFFNALSLVFPVGERFFIDCVREFESEVTDPPLKQAVRGFIGQEGRHAREHRAYNDRLCALRHYDLATLEAPQRRRVAWAKQNVSRYQRLAATVAYEHITALLADELLRNDHWLTDAPAEMAALWRWHAVEETEHKAVAFDVYRAVGGREAPRCAMLRFATFALLKDLLASVYAMLKADGRHRDWRVWRSGFRFMLGRGGVIRSLARPWRDFRRTDFHPWQHDNRDLIARWDAWTSA
ncbi:MAG: metal-dependent hydrolase [Pseudomonadota bacterium]